MREHVIHVRLDDEELKLALELAKAGRVSVGAVIRGLLWSGVKDENTDHQAMRGARTVHMAKRGVGAAEVAAGGTVDDSGRVAAKGKTCPHGTAKGGHCWQCGGLAVIP